MATPVTEILTLANTEVNLRECAELVAKHSPGFQRSYWGERVQDPELRQWFIANAIPTLSIPDWDERPKNTNPEVAKTGYEKLRVGASQPSEKKLVAFKPFPPSKCFSAPITEVIYATAKPDTDLEEFNKIVDVSLKACDDFKGCYGTSWGYVLDTEREIVMVVGWENVETHVNFTKTEECRLTTGPFREVISQASMYYVKTQAM
ncbi:hypothetical protein BV22DRAFT_1116026 [Leucogyrophana mollusca]|uniref:Uncharacterized protein n=1 Tax=Leucogyrophana mollusca TaxID=85980 RepID=A0ACB8BZL1_9AGAM|nr:hypothetical protein BV22DRAFT_1116026 [Leucogyrophana mollusca]